MPVSLQAICRTTCSVKEDKLCPPSLSKSFVHSNSSVGTQKKGILGPAIWSDMISVNTITQWRQDWSSAYVVNHTTVTNPTIRQPGFYLPLPPSPSCDRGQRQTMNHIVDMCPLTKFECGLNLLHEADDAFVWVESTATAALAK